MTLQLIEIFSSVQGESTFTGLPTTFIRLAACNLRCTWCDTAYSFGRGTTTAMADIIEKAENFGNPYICITGGEPLLQPNVLLLMKELCDRKFQLSIETGGSLSTRDIDPRVRVILDVKCPGSGMKHKNLWDNLSLLRPIDEVKFVLANREDFEYAKAVCEKYCLFDVLKRGNILFSPVHGVLNAQDLVQWILSDKLPVRLNLQIHKFIWDPQTQGV